MPRPRWGFGTGRAASLLAALVQFAVPASAHAQDGMPGTDGPMRGSSEVLLGLGAGNNPVYLGSDERGGRLLPIISARWASGWFAGLGGAGYRFGAAQPASWGLRVTLDPGRDETDADALRGMGDIKARPEFGVFADYRLMPGLGIGTSLRHGSGNDRDGLLLDFRLRGGLPVSATLRVVGGVTATFANTRAMQTGFGVNAAQSLASGYAPYRAGGGLRDIGMQVGGMLLLGPDVMLFASVNTRTLLGDARDSPLTRERSGVGALVSLAYRL